MIATADRQEYGQVFFERDNEIELTNSEGDEFLEGRTTIVWSWRKPDTWEKIERELLQLFSLEDDWDCSGAKKPRRELVFAAIKWLSHLKQHGSLPPSNITPGGDGEVSLVWQSANEYLAAELRHPDRIDWMRKTRGLGAERETSDTRVIVK